MAQGDWTGGTTMRLELVNVTFDDSGVINHIGIGFHVVLPSGQVAASKGFTWSPPAAHRTRLQTALSAMIADAMADEGVSALAPARPKPVPPAVIGG